MEHIVWHDEKVTKQDILDARDFLALFGVKMHIKKVSGGGEVDIKKRLIMIDPSELSKIRKFWGIILHELWHCLCHDQNLFKNFNSHKLPRTKKELQRYRRIAFKAEKFIDKKAAQMLNDYFPGIPYTSGYQTVEDKKWYHDKYLNKYFSMDKYFKRS